MTKVKNERAVAEIGFGQQPVKTRMKLTVKNEILYSGPDPCGGDALVDVSMLRDETKAAGAQVELYFATASDGGGSGWTANGTADYPFLMQNSIEVSAGQTTRVELRFNTAGTLTCIGVSAKLSAPTISVLNYVEEPASSSIVGDYWFVHYNVCAHIYDETGAIITDPSMGEVFVRTEVISGWGTVTFDAEGNWSVYMGNLYTDDTHPGMAEHRHNLVSNAPAEGGGYFNPSDTSVDPGTAVGGRYVVAGSKIIMYMPEGGFIEGGISSDGNTFVGTNLSTRETDLIYAVRKTTGHAATFPVDRKYVMCQPRFDIHYDDVTLKTDRLSFDAEFSVLDSSTGDNKTFNWRTPVQFIPHYDVDELLDSWTSTGPEEQAEESLFLPDVTISTDGLITGADIKGLAALGAGGSGVYGGKAEDFDAFGDHCVTVGFILDAHTAPSLSDLAGTWVMGMLEGEVEAGTEGWDTGDETAGFGISFGELTIDSSGNVAGEFVYKNAFTGEIEHNPVTVTISGPVDECYKVNQDITTSPCTDGITLPVFIATEGGATVAKIALDRTKNVISIWKPIDTDGVPFNTIDDPCTQGDTCGDANPKFQFGLGVKVE